MPPIRTGAKAGLPCQLVTAGDRIRWLVSGLHVQGYEGAAEGERRSVAASTRSPKLQQRARRSQPIEQITGEGGQKFGAFNRQPASNRFRGRNRDSPENPG